MLYRGGAEQKIRKYLVMNNFIDAVVNLPSNLFFGTNIATCIIVLRKNKKNDSTLFIDASSEFTKISNNSKLEESHIKQILDWYEKRTDVAHKVALVSNDAIAQNDYNLSVSTYVEAEDTREAIDITELNAEIAHTVTKVDELRKSINQIVEEIEG